MNRSRSILGKVDPDEAAFALVERIREVWSRSEALVRRRLSSRTVAGSNHPARVEFVAAWEDLRNHPSLMWVPPMWRTTDESGPELSEAERRYAVRAIDRNLTVHIVSDNPAHGCIELAVGPLVDRRIGGRVDPTTPVGKQDPSLRVRATSFEAAVIELRDAVVDAYGPVVDQHHRRVEPEQRSSRRMWPAVLGGHMFVDGSDGDVLDASERSTRPRVSARLVGQSGTRGRRH